MHAQIARSPGPMIVPFSPGSPAPSALPDSVARSSTPVSAPAHGLDLGFSSPGEAAGLYSSAESDGRRSRGKLRALLSCLPASSFLMKSPVTWKWFSRCFGHKFL